MRRGKIAGVVTEKMLLTFTPGKSTSLDAWEAHYLLSKTPVKEAMNPRPHTVTPTTPVREAAKLLHDRKLNGVLVTNEKGDLIGIFTITNALEALMAAANADGG
jgi:acetoin utilization protein AcuB